MNGFKRASRRQAAVVGLAVLMGASLFGCHAGPRLFSKKDRDRSADKQALAEKDKGKFINRKKVRPESEYRDDTDERVAKSDSKPKPKSKPTVAKKNASSDSVERAVAARRQADDAADDAPRSTRSTTNAPKSSKSADRSAIARRDSTKRPVTDLLNDDPLFQDVLPETRTTAKGTANGSSATRSTAAKSKLMDEDPFKNSVIGSKATKRPEKSVSTVNFLDDDDLDDELDEEADELEVARQPAAKTAIAKTVSKANSLHRQAAASVPQSKQKFLDESEEPSNNSFRSLIGEEAATVSSEEPIAAPNPKTVKRTSDAAKTVAGQKVLDRRKDVQQTLNDWRRDLDSDESPTGVEEKVSLPAPLPSARKQNPPAAKGHLEQTTIEEFTPPIKSQGAVLNGELIIDTTSLPSRFQRTPGSANDPSNNKGTGAKVNSNSGASIDIVPGATQNRARSSGQISLQSLTQEDAATGLTTAAYEPSHTPDAFGKLPSLKLETDSEEGPKFGVLEDDPGIAPGPPEEISESVSENGQVTTSAGSRKWKRAWLVIAAMASAVGIAFGLRRRMELIPEPVRASKQQPQDDSQSPESWPRG